MRIAIDSHEPVMVVSGMYLTQYHREKLVHKKPQPTRELHSSGRDVIVAFENTPTDSTADQKESHP